MLSDLEAVLHTWTDKTHVRSIASTKKKIVLMMQDTDLHGHYFRTCYLVQLATNEYFCLTDNKRGDRCGTQTERKLPSTWGEDPSNVGPDSLPQG